MKIFGVLTICTYLCVVQMHHALNGALNGALKHSMNGALNGANINNFTIWNKHHQQKFFQYRI